MNATATVDVSAEDCLKALEHKLCPGGYRGRPWPNSDLVERLQELHAKVMKDWIAPADRCRECAGTGECAGSGRKGGGKS